MHPPLPAPSCLTNPNPTRCTQACLPPDNPAGIGLAAAVRASNPAATVGPGPTDDLVRLSAFCFNGTCYEDNVLRARDAVLTVAPGVQDPRGSAAAAAQGASGGRAGGGDLHYSWELRNVTRVCARTVDPACLEASSANTCYDNTFQQYQSELATQGRPANVWAAQDPKQRVGAIAVPVAVGGALLVAAAAAVALFVFRNRRLRWLRRSEAAARQCEAAAAGSPGWQASTESQQESEYQQAWSM